MNDTALKSKADKFERFIPAVSKLLTFYYKIKVRLK